MNKLIYLLLLLSFYKANSQYYYKDILAAADVTNQMKTYATNNVRKIMASSTTPEGAPDRNFSEVYEITESTLKIITKTDNVTSSLRHVFNSNGQLIITVDSATGVKSTTTYAYDANGNIISISNAATDADSSAHFSQSEIHQYIYKDGKLDKMWRIINKKDSLEVRFVSDKNGSVIEEWNVKRGVFSDPIHYYYDEKNRLTDIVRFNHRANRLLPDFMFVYDENDRVIQKVTTISGGNIGYLTWRYVFDGRGLKTKEAIYSKEKNFEGEKVNTLKGRIDYSYN
jgi:YD repeat-containing protein